VAISRIFNAFSQNVIPNWNESKKDFCSKVGSIALSAFSFYKAFQRYKAGRSFVYTAGLVLGGFGALFIPKILASCFTVSSPTSNSSSSSPDSLPSKDARTYKIKFKNGEPSLDLATKNQLMQALTGSSQEPFRFELECDKEIREIDFIFLKEIVQEATKEVVIQDGQGSTTYYPIGLSKGSSSIVQHLDGNQPIVDQINFTCTVRHGIKKEEIFMQVCPNGADRRMTLTFTKDINFGTGC
jgi:hypothetical protein